jgi:hypothetical protein
VAQVAETHREVRLIILGDGPQREALETYAQAVGLADRVIFTGIVPFEAIPAYLKAADIFCFASTTETQGLVTMEALAAGLPVVAVDAIGTRDAIVSGQEGLLTDNDPAALAQAIQQILENDALLTQLKTNALKKADTFEMIIQAKKMAAVYEQAIEDKKANRYVRVDRDMVEAAMKERLKKRLRRPEKGEDKLNRLRLNLNRRWVRVLDIHNAASGQQPFEAAEGDQAGAAADRQTE